MQGMCARSSLVSASQEGLSGRCLRGDSPLNAKQNDVAGGGDTRPPRETVPGLSFFTPSPDSPLSGMSGVRTPCLYQQGRSCLLKQFSAEKRVERRPTT